MTPERLSQLYDTVMKDRMPADTNDRRCVRPSQRCKYIALISKDLLHVPSMRNCSGFCLLPSLEHAIVYSDKAPSKWIKESAHTIWINYREPSTNKVSFRAKKFLTNNRHLVIV